VLVVAKGAPYIFIGHSNFYYQFDEKNRRIFDCRLFFWKIREKLSGKTEKTTEIFSFSKNRETFFRESCL
jgi:hypothetical protein